QYKLKPRPHRICRQPDDHGSARFMPHRDQPAAHASDAVMDFGSNLYALPSHIDRVARSTITITFVPSSTPLSGACRVRIDDSQPSRCWSWSLPMSGHSMVFSSTSST